MNYGRFHPCYVPTKEKDVVARPNPNGIAIMRLDNHQHFFNLDGIAAEFWSLMDGKTSLEQIRKTLIKKFRPPQSRFDKDLRDLLDELAREKLIVAPK